MSFGSASLTPVPRYYFNVRNGHGFIADDEGLELSSDQDARMEAISGARSLLSAEVLDGALDLSGQIEVTNDINCEVLRVRFRDTVNIREETFRIAADR